MLERLYFGDIVGEYSSGLERSSWPWSLTPTPSSWIQGCPVKMAWRPPGKSGTGI